MADDPGTPQSAGEAMGAVQTPAIQLLYANATRVNGAAFDVAIDFGYQVADEPAQWTMRVAMSWEHARVLASTIQKGLESYEEQVGPIPNLEHHRSVQQAEERS